MGDILYRWLHISDLHVFDSTDNNLMGEALISFIRKFQPNFMVVTGDFRHKNYPNECNFENTLAYLNKIVEASGLDKRHVYLVPGNHDVNDYKARDVFIDNIRGKVNDDPDCYHRFSHGELGDLYEGFKEYDSFVRDFYENSLDEGDSRLARPADVLHCIWENRVNLILLNTALISESNSQLPQISDIKTFSEIELDPSLPTLVLGHHGIDRMVPAHQCRIAEILNNKNIRAYLCGDAHKVNRYGIDKSTIPNSTIPQFVCGKSAPQTGDHYSDLSVIGYTCKDDGNAYVQVYRYMSTTECGSRSFQPYPDFMLTDEKSPDGKLFSFPMFDPIVEHKAVAPETVEKEDIAENIAPIPQVDHYRSNWEFFGRENEIEELVAALSGAESGMHWVIGVAGLGKTELCKAVARKMRKTYIGWNMPYIVVKSISSYSAFISALAQGLQIELPEKEKDWKFALQYTLYLRKVQWNFPPAPAIYFDNFEDIFHFCEKDAQGKIYALLKDIRDYGYHILFSSQIDPGRADMCETAIDLSPLNYREEGLDMDSFLALDSCRLFLRIWKKTLKEKELPQFRKLISELSGHPLAIVLTANMTRVKRWSISSALTNWPTATQRPDGNDDRHSSLNKALELVWTSVKDNPNALLYWAMSYYSVVPIPESLHPFFNKVCGNLDPCKGIDILMDYNLLIPEEIGYSMLRPIQEVLPRLLSDSSVLLGGLHAWAMSFLQLLEDWESKDRERHYSALHHLLPLMPQLLHTLEQLGEMGISQLPLLRDLAHSSLNIYGYCLSSVDTLHKLCNYTHIQNDNILYSSFLLRSGSLQFILGNISESMNLYKQAEKLYRKEHDTLGLASTLHAMGDLQCFLVQPNKALALYLQAKKLYQKEQNELGIANTLKSMGTLQVYLKSNIKEGHSLYQQAANLYRKVQNDLGLANTFYALGELHMLMGNEKDAHHLYQQAESLYRKEQDDLGLANTLYSIGNLQIRLGMNAEAVITHQQAVELLQKAHDPLKQISPLHSLFDLQSRWICIGNYDAMPITKTAELARSYSHEYFHYCSCYKDRHWKTEKDQKQYQQSKALMKPFSEVANENN